MLIAGIFPVLLLSSNLSAHYTPNSPPRSSIAAGIFPRFTQPPSPWVFLHQVGIFSTSGVVTSLREWSTGDLGRFSRKAAGGRRWNLIPRESLAAQSDRESSESHPNAAGKIKRGSSTRSFRLTAGAGSTGHLLKGRKLSLVVLGNNRVILQAVNS